VKTQAEGTRRFEATGAIIVGLAMMVGGAILLAEGCEQGSDARRWRGAPVVGRVDTAGVDRASVGELQAIGSGNDVVLVGSIDWGNQVAVEGFVLYDRLERRRDALDGRDYWTRVSSHRPAFDVLLEDQIVTVDSSQAALQAPHVLLAGSDVEYRGFILGQEVTVCGTLVSPDVPFEVQASVICGGSSEGCLADLSGGSSVLLKIGPVLMLIGGGCIGLGLRQLKVLSANGTA